MRCIAPLDAFGSTRRQEAKKLVTKIHARIKNARQDYLHKLSRKLTNESKVIVVENLNIKGQRECADRRLNDDWGSLASRVRNHKLAKHISDAGRGCAQVAYSDALSHSALRWGMLVNFCDYKLERENKRLVEIDRWFPSSHICPDCLTQQPKMDLTQILHLVREKSKPSSFNQGLTVSN